MVDEYPDLSEVVGEMTLKKDKVTVKDLHSSMTQLTRQLNDMFSMFASAADKLEIEEKQDAKDKAFQEIVEKLDKILDENKTIAKSLVKITDMLKEDKRSNQLIPPPQTISKPASTIPSPRPLHTPPPSPTVSHTTPSSPQPVAHPPQFPPPSQSPGRLPTRTHARDTSSPSLPDLDSLLPPSTPRQPQSPMPPPTRSPMPDLQPPPPPPPPSSSSQIPPPPGMSSKDPLGDLDLPDLDAPLAGDKPKKKGPFNLFGKK